jgi:hypothetical protein
MPDRLHLWPDKSPGNMGRMPKPKEHLGWLWQS